jgi:5-methylcytosine-specific restriction endonuclease McrA
MSESARGKATSGNGSDDKELSCRECGKVYQSFQGLRYHYNNTECEGFECPDCGASSFTSRRGLVRHRGSEHEGHYSIHEQLMDAEWFREKYHNEGLSTGDIADLLGCARCLAQTWKERHGIETNTEHKSRGRGEDNPMWVDNTIIITCDYCGENAERVETNVNSDRTFCSWECSNKWKSENWVGEKNPLYKGGPQNYGQGWKAAREKALGRDGHTCQDCGATDSLTVHHIQPVRSFDDPTDAHFLENLRTLCRSCHQKWEGIPVGIDTRE